jgi:predicted dehydrogenase
MKLGAVVDINPEAARAFGNSFGCNSFTSLDDYLASGNLADCAIICTPPSDHTDTACKLMQNRIHVLCEPPFALTSNAAGKMIDVSRAYGATLMMGSNSAMSRTLFRLKASSMQILGHVLEFEGDFREMVDMSSRWNVQPEIAAVAVNRQRQPAWM